MNLAILSGRLTRDPKIKNGSGDMAVCEFDLAVKKIKPRKKDGKDVNFISFVAWGATATNLVKFCKKGSLILVNGSLETDSYSSNTGTKDTATIVCYTIEYLSSNSDKKEEAKPSKTKERTASDYNDGVPLNQIDEDLPF